MSSYGGSGKFGDVNLNIVVSGKEQLTAVEDTIRRISRGSDFHRYWKDVDSLISDVEESSARFADNLDASSAKDLLKSFNALRAITNDTIDSGKFKNYQTVIENIGRASRTIDSDALAGIDVSVFKQAFYTMGLFTEKLENGKASAESLRRTLDMFNALSMTDSIKDQSSAVEDLNKQLSTLKSNYQKVSEEREQYKQSYESERRSFQRYRDTSDYGTLEKEKDQLQYKLDMVIANAVSEFREFAKSNGITRDGLKNLDMLNGIDVDDDWSDTSMSLQLKFDSIVSRLKTGAMGYAEAIAEFKTTFYNVLKTNNGDGSGDGAVESDVVESFSTRISGLSEKIDEAVTKIGETFAKVEELGASIRKVDEQLANIGNASSDGGTAGSGSNAISSAVAESIEAYTQNVSNLLDNLMQALKKAEGAYEQNTNAAESIKAMATVLSSLKELGANSGGNLATLSSILLNFSQIDKFSIDVRNLRKIQDFANSIQSAPANDNIKNLSKLDFGTFKDMKIDSGSVKSLTNLFNTLNTYVSSDSSGKNAIDIIKSIDFSGLKSINGISIDDGAIESLRKLLSVFSEFDGKIPNMSGLNLSIPVVPGVAEEIRKMLESYNIPEITGDILKDSTRITYGAGEDEVNAITRSFDSMTESGQRARVTIRQVRNEAGGLDVASKDLLITNDNEKKQREKLAVDNAKSLMDSSIRGLSSSISVMQGKLSDKEGSENILSTYSDLSSQLEQIKLDMDNVSDSEGMSTLRTVLAGVAKDMSIARVQANDFLKVYAQAEKLTPYWEKRTEEMGASEMSGTAQATQDAMAALHGYNNEAKNASESFRAIIELQKEAASVMNAQSSATTTIRGLETSISSMRSKLIDKDGSEKLLANYDAISERINQIRSDMSNAKSTDAMKVVRTQIADVAKDMGIAREEASGFLKEFNSSEKISTSVIRAQDDMMVKVKSVELAISSMKKTLGEKAGSGHFLAEYEKLAVKLSSIKTLIGKATSMDDIHTASVGLKELNIGLTQARTNALNFLNAVNSSDKTKKTISKSQDDMLTRIRGTEIAISSMREKLSGISGSDSIVSEFDEISNRLTKIGDEILKADSTDNINKQRIALKELAQDLGVLRTKSEDFSKAYNSSVKTDNAISKAKEDIGLKIRGAEIALSSMRSKIAGYSGSEDIVSEFDKISDRLKKIKENASTATSTDGIRQQQLALRALAQDLGVVRTKSQDYMKSVRDANKEAEALAKKEAAEAKAVAKKEAADAKAVDKRKYGKSGEEWGLESRRKEIDSYLESLKGMEGDASADSLVAKLEKVKTLINEAQAELNNIDSPDGFRKFEQMMRDLDTEFKLVKKDFTDFNSDNFSKNTDARTDALSKFNDGLKKTNALLEKYKYVQNSGSDEERSAYINLQNAAESYAEAINKIDSSNAKQAGSDIKKFALEVSEADRILAAGYSSGRNKKSFLETFTGSMSKFATYFSATRIIMAAYRGMKQMVTESININDAMTQLQIVTKATDAEMAQYGKTAFETAKRIGTSAEDVIDATTTYARLGNSLSDSNEMARLTTMLQSVGDIEAEDAQNAVTAIVKAFDVDASSLQTFMDKLVAVGNGAPISVSQLAEGLNNASSALASAGNSFDETVALLTAANTTVQNASKSSTALRTITARIRNTKTELDELGEEALTDAKYDEIVKSLTSITDVDGNKISVSLKDANGEFRKTYDIIKDIAAIWDKIDTNSQAAIVEKLAGTRNQDIFYSLVGNFEEASKAMGLMQDASSGIGELQSAYDIFMQSSTAHVNQFKAAFSELSTDLIDSGVVNFIVDAGKALVEFIDMFAEAGATGLLGLVASISAVVTGLVSVKKAISAISGVKTVASVIAAVKSAISPLTAVIFGIGAAVAAAGIVYKKISDAGGLSKLSMNNNLEEFEETKADVESLNEQLDNTISRMNELQSKKTLSLVEESELQNLRETVELLKQKQAIEEKKAERDAVNTLKSVNEAFDKEFPEPDEYIESARIVGESLRNTYETGNTIQRENDENWLEAGIQSLDAYKEEYVKILDFLSGEDRENAEKRISLADYMLKQMWIAYDENKWKNMQYDSMLDVYDLKKAREELVKIANESDNIGITEQQIRDRLPDIDQYLAEYGLTIQDMVRDINSQATLFDREVLMTRLDGKIGQIASDSANATIEDVTGWLNSLSNSDFKLVFDLLFNSNGRKFTLDQLDAELLKSKYGTEEYNDIVSDRVESIDKEIDRYSSYIDAIKEYNAASEEQAKYISIIAKHFTHGSTGNVDMYNRQTIVWDEASRNQFAKAIDSYGQDINDYVDGTISTVLGSAITFTDSKGNGIDIAFSPILQTEDGPVVIGSGTMESYIGTLLSNVEDFTDENAVRTTVLELDKKGLQVDGIFVKNMIAGIGEDAVELSEALHYIGNDNAYDTARNVLTSLAKDSGAASLDEFIGNLQTYINEYDALSEKAQYYHELQKQIRMESINKTASNIRSSIATLWGSDDFKSTKNSLVKLAKTVDGISDDKIVELAESSDDLREVLEADGMTAQFLASVLTSEALNSGSGFSAITAEALALNSALNAAAESFNDITYAKSKYDAAISGGEVDQNFRSMADAYSKLNEEIEAGRHGNTYWAAAEYLFGSGNLENWKYSEELINKYAESLKGVFGDADTAGFGFFDKLNEIAKDGKVTADDGSIIAEITRLSDGSYNFSNFDLNYLDELSSKMNMSKEAIMACVQATSLYGSTTLYDLDNVISVMKDYDIASDAFGGTVVNLSHLNKVLADLGYKGKSLYDVKQSILGLNGVTFVDANDSAENLISTLQSLGAATQDGGQSYINVDKFKNLAKAISLSNDEITSMYDTLSAAGYKFLSSDGSSASIDDILNAPIEATVEVEVKDEKVDELIAKVRNIDSTVNVSVNKDSFNEFIAYAKEEIKGLMNPQEASSGSTESETGKTPDKSSGHITDIAEEASSVASGADINQLRDANLLVEQLGTAFVNLSGIRRAFFANGKDENFVSAFLQDLGKIAGISFVSISDDVNTLLTTLQKAGATIQDGDSVLGIDMTKFMELVNAISLTDGEVTAIYKKFRNAGYEFFPGEKEVVLEPDSSELDAEIAEPAKKEVEVTTSDSSGQTGHLSYDALDTIEILKTWGDASDAFGNTIINASKLNDELIKLGYSGRGLNDLKKSILGLDGVFAIGKDSTLGDLIDTFVNNDIFNAGIDGLSVDIAQFAKLAKSINLTKDDIISIYNTLDSNGFHFKYSDSDQNASIMEILKLTVDDEEVTGWESPQLDATVSFNVDDSAVRSHNFNQTATVTYTAKGGEILGTNLAGGTNSAAGGLTLVGELGREIIARDGHFMTVGDNGAELVNLKSGDIVFNNSDTEKILHGKPGARGRSLANGNVHGNAMAMVNTIFGGGGGSSNSNGLLGAISGFTNTISKTISGAVAKLKNDISGNAKDPKKNNGGDSGGGGSSDDDKNKEKIDWIEVAIDRIERAIKKLQSLAENTVKSLEKRLGASSDAITKLADEIRMQTESEARYLQEAEEVELDDDLKELVRNGTIDINSYSKETKELIDDYKKWYEKSLDCAEAIDTLHESIASLYQSNFTAIQTNFENQIAEIEHAANIINTRLESIEERGYTAGSAFYNALKENESARISVLQKELADLESSFAKAIDSGEIDEYSESWYEMKSSINSVTEAIEESKSSLIEYDNSIRQIDWDRFDYGIEKISEITEEAEFLIDLLEQSDMFGENGMITEAGDAVLGMRAQNYALYMAQADKYANEIKKINDQISEDPFNNTLLERRKELIEAQRQSIQNANNEKVEIQSLIKEGISSQLDAMKELIDKYEEAADAAKDLYDYQKSIKEEAKKVTDIEKQLAAYSGNTSEETRATVQKLKVSLEDAQENLRDKEYSRFASDQKKLLDNLYDEYEKILNERADDIDALLEEVIDSTNKNSSDILSTIVEASNSVGYDISEGIREIWSTGSETLDGVLTMYGENFADQLTSVNAVLKQIEAATTAMAEHSESISAGSIPRFANGGAARFTGLAMLDGSSGSPEVVLNQRDSANFIALRDILRNVDVRGDGIISSSMLSGAVDVNRVMSSIGHIGNAGIGDINISIPIERVVDYNDMVNQMRDDPRFEKLIHAMTIDQLNGGSKIAKKQYRW